MFRRSIVALLLAGHANSGGGAPRQKYSAWQYYPEKNYYYCKYEYKVSANAPTNSATPRRR